MLKRFLFTLALVLSCLGLNAQTKIAYGKTYVADDYVLKMTLKKLRKVLAKEGGNVRNPCEYGN